MFKSELQKKLFYAAAHNSKIAKENNMSQTMAKNYIADSAGEVEPQADKPKKFSKLSKKLNINNS